MASDVGPTISGVDAGNTDLFVYELCWAVASRRLQPEKFAVALKAAGVWQDDLQLDGQIVDTLW